MNYVKNKYSVLIGLLIIVVILSMIALATNNSNTVYVGGKKVSLGASSNNSPEYLGLGTYTITGLDVLENEGFSIDQIGQIKSSFSDLLYAKFDSQISKVIFTSSTYTENGLQFKLVNDKNQVLAEGYIIDDRGRGFTITLTSLNGSPSNLSSGYVSLEDLNG